MYGHYSELQQFAREFAATRSRRGQGTQRPPNVQEARRKKNKLWSELQTTGWLGCLGNAATPPLGIWKWVNAKILPYVIDWVFVLVLGILMAALSFLIDFLIEKISQGPPWRRAS